MKVKNQLLVVMALTFSAETIASTDKVVYGADNRVEVENSTNSDYVEWGKAVAARIDKKALTKVGPFYTFPKKTLGEQNYLCADEQFTDQYAPADCSGFLVGPKHLVTAGHCVTPSALGDQMACDKGVWTFDYNNSEVKTGLLKASNVYKCKKIVNHDYNPLKGRDYALIELDREVEGVKPLKFRTEGSVSLGTPLAIIGAPSGLPLKVADNALVLAKSSQAPIFVSNLDSFGGNSGSPVINTISGEVEGILVRGAKDYVVNYERRCVEVNKCQQYPTMEGGCYGESVTMIGAVEVNKFVK